MGFSEASIREKAKIEPRPSGLLMTIEVYASYEGWVSVNDRPVTVRGDEATTWSAANVIVSAHLVNLARELAKRRKTWVKPPPGTSVRITPAGTEVRSTWVRPT